MTSSLFRRLALAALFLLLGTLGALDYVLSGSPARAAVLGIVTGAALIAGAVALFIVHSLTLRVNRLKRAAEGLLGSHSEYASRVDTSDDLGALERSLTGLGEEIRTLLSRLRFESARREAILSGMAEGVLVVDRDMRVAFCNRALLRAIGFRGDSYEGLGVLGLVRDPALYQLIRSGLATGESDQLRFKLAADTPRTFEVKTTPLEMPNGRGLIAIFHDITELDRLEQVRKDFVANVSHELRTPLAGIIGYADTLLEGGIDEPRHRVRFVEIIRSNAVRLSNIAADLLTLSELESGADTQEAETINVRAVLDAAMVTVESEAREREVDLIREEIQEVWVLGSRLRLEQALLNLLANAIKFNRPHGEVRVRVFGNGGNIAIRISDTGVGIPSQDLPRIFERFYRVDKARSRQVGGTGLGLSIVKHVIERMNGTVTVESQLGRGSTFTVVLPSAKIPASA
jgi:two-component system phosphate regulon sensor histidine kinase PhoR